MMSEFVHEVEALLERAKEEPSDTSCYEEGLEIGLVVGGKESTKQRLVERLTSHIEIELENGEYDGELVNGLITCLKTALKQEGDLELDQYIVKTPVDVIVKLEDGTGIPKNMVGKDEEYEELWSMPEILVFDKTFREYAVKY